MNLLLRFLKVIQMFLGLAVQLINLMVDIGLGGTLLADQDPYEQSYTSTQNESNYNFREPLII